jgi:hypothetical protein
MRTDNLSTNYIMIYQQMWLFSINNKNECWKIYLIRRENGTTLWCMVNVASDWHSCTYIHSSYQGAAPMVTGGSWLSLLAMISPSESCTVCCLLLLSKQRSSHNKVVSCLKDDEHKTDNEVERVSQWIQHAWSGIHSVINYSEYDPWQRISLTLWFQIGTVFWDILPCSSLKDNWCFRGTCRLHLQAQGISQARNQCESRSTYYSVGPIQQS